MPLFDYAGFDAAGRRIHGSLEADGRRAAFQALQARGIHPTDLGEVAGNAARGRWTWQRRPSLDELAGVARQFSTLLGAGLPLDDALDTVVDQSGNARLERGLREVRAAVVGGEPLHVALGRHPSLFPAVMIDMVRVGESSGRLDQVLARLADHFEAQSRLASRLQGAMAYPFFMALVGSGVLVFLMASVVPKVVRMLTDLGQGLPWPTRLLVTVSDLLQGWWWLMLLAAAGSVEGLRRLLRQPHWRRRADALVLKLPIAGRLVRQVITVRVCRTLGTLLESGMPLLAALRIVREMPSNLLFREAMAEATQAVHDGEGFGNVLRRQEVFPPLVGRMVEVGERTGALDAMLGRVADSQERQLDTTLTALLALVEPLLILVMGGVIGFIVLAVLLPIFEASQGLG